MYLAVLFVIHFKTFNWIPRALVPCVYVYSRYRGGLKLLFFLPGVLEIIFHYFYFVGAIFNVTCTGASKFVTWRDKRTETCALK